MTIPVYILLGYGLLLIVGGFIGYFVAGSKISLIAGILCGIVLQGATMLARAGFEKGAMAAGFTVLLLLSFFSYRYWLTVAFMPAGMMVLASLVALGASLFLISRR